jgi:hypothetical protein
MISITVETTTYKVNELHDKAKKAKDEYEHARNEVMREICKFLAQRRGEGFTAKELSKMFDMSTRVIAREASEFGMRSRPRIQHVRFVELLPDGESVNYNHEIVHRIKCNEYYY